MIDVNYQTNLIKRIKIGGLTAFEGPVSFEAFSQYINRADDSLMILIAGKKSLSEVTHIETLFKRLIDDEPIIKSMIRYRQEEQLLLTSISISNGDHHTHGGGVSILGFTKAYTKNSVKLVYKTGPVRPDLITIGDLEFYSNLITTLTTYKLKQLTDYMILNSFYEILNIILISKRQSECPIKPYRVVPIERDVNGTSLSINRIYGYIEYIKGTLYKDANLRKITIDSNIGSYILNNPYYSLGFLIGSVHFLRSTDLHSENVILEIIKAGQHTQIVPKPIDFEVIFDPQYLVSATQTIDHLTEPNPRNPMIDINVSQNPYYGHIYDIGVKTFNKLVYDHEQQIADWLNSAAVRTTPMRVLLDDTTKLYQMLWCSPFVKQPLYKDELFILNKNFLDKISRWEIPAFYMYANDTKVYDAEGNIVVFNAEEIVDAIYDMSNREYLKRFDINDLKLTIPNDNQLFEHTPYDIMVDHTSNTYNIPNRPKASFVSSKPIYLI